MTEEQAFIEALASDPYDHTTRLVYADWLADRGDIARETKQRALAEGYAALRVQSFSTDQIWFNRARVLPAPPHTAKCLPEDWFLLLEGGTFAEDPGLAQWYEFPAGADPIEAAAVAFFKLPAERRADLLHQPLPLPGPDDYRWPQWGPAASE